MKKVVPNGVAIKELREQLERLSTQKELANEVGISVRMLRMIENENAPIPVATAERLAKTLQVHRERIILAPDRSRAVVKPDNGKILASLMDDQDRIIPRHDYDIANATSDEGWLYDKAAESHDVACCRRVIAMPWRPRFSWLPQ